MSLRIKRLCSLLCAWLLAVGVLLPSRRGGAEQLFRCENGQLVCGHGRRDDGAGLLSGYPDGTFRPSRTISAAEFVAIVARCGGLQAAASSGAHWASGTMQAALNAGWYDWDELPPTGEKYDQPIARQLAVNILMRALLPDKTGDYNTESAKMDDFSELSCRYYNKVLAAYACGVVCGGDRGCFHPASGLTRAEACAIIQRALALTDGTAAPVTPSEPETPSVSAEAKGGVSAHGWLQVKGRSSAMRAARRSRCTA